MELWDGSKDGTTKCISSCNPSLLVSGVSMEDRGWPGNLSSFCNGGCQQPWPQSCAVALEVHLPCESSLEITELLCSKKGLILLTQASVDLRNFIKAFAISRLC